MLRGDFQRHQRSGTAPLMFRHQRRN